MTKYLMQKYLAVLCALLLTGCQGQSEQNSEANANKPIEQLVEKSLHARMLEDVPVEDRKYLLDDTSILIPKASRRYKSPSASIKKHKIKRMPDELGTYYLIAGSFNSQAEAQLLVNFFETEGLAAVILPYKGMRRVAIKLVANEESAREQLKALNKKYDGILSFWFLRGHTFN